MSVRFTVNFKGSNDNSEASPFVMPFRLADHAVAQLWWRELFRYSQYSEHRPEVRYFAFPGEPPQARIREQLHVAVTIINSWSPGSLEKLPSGEWSQDVLNALHYKFESMIGSLETKQLFYQSAPQEVQQAIGVLNDCVHELEMIRYNSPRVNARFPACVRSEIKNSDLKLFSFDRQFGDVVLGYSQLGKQIMDVWIENDEDVSDDNIRPLRHCAPDFELYLRKGLNSDEQKERYRQMAPWLKKRGYDPHDPALCLGWIVLARWDRDRAAGVAPKEVVRRIAERQNNMCIVDEDGHGQMELSVAHALSVGALKQSDG